MPHGASEYFDLIFVEKVGGSAHMGCKSAVRRMTENPDECSLHLFASSPPCKGSANLQGGRNLMKGNTEVSLQFLYRLSVIWRKFGGSATLSFDPQMLVRIEGPTIAGGLPGGTYQVFKSETSNSLWYTDISIEHYPFTGDVAILKNVIFYSYVRAVSLPESNRNLSPHLSLFCQ